MVLLEGYAIFLQLNDNIIRIIILYVNISGGDDDNDDDDDEAGEEFDLFATGEEVNSPVNSAIRCFAASSMDIPLSFPQCPVIFAIHKYSLSGLCLVSTLAENTPNKTKIT